jgi:RNA polymerase sigma factor (sigma-70 family)
MTTGASAFPVTATQVAETVLLDPERRRQLFSYASSRFGISASDAEDLLQETVLELLRCQTCIQKPEGFAFAVFRSRCTRFVSRQVAARGVFTSEEASAVERPCRAPVEADEQVALREALDSISTACRRLLRAYYVEGQSLREAATTVSLAYSSVAKTISRCLQRLRRCLA